ncbi:MAG: HTH domain-containing protein [Chloroflexi bacterium]|nr:HTH domain-containing protein [Chloroflexota bacterium]
MKALDAAAIVLRDADEPLHYLEITERMLVQKLWTTQRKTPWDTVRRQLAEHIKAQGSASRFVKRGPGVFALSTDVVTDTLSFTDAAEEVLIQSTEQQPLHYTEITRRALERGLIRTQGRTPAATMYSGILTEIRNRAAHGDSQRFVRHGRGLFGLAAWLPVGVAGQIEKQNREVRRLLLERARTASPTDFENLVGELLVAVGFEDVEVTKTSGDGGIDVRGTLVVADAVRIRMAVQAKRWKRNVPAPVVQQLRGSLGAHDQGLIITTSDFSRGVTREANRSDAAPVALMSGEQIAALLAENQIGARVTSYDLYTLDPIES